MKPILILFAAFVLVSACQNSAQEKTAAPVTTASSDPQNYTTIQWLDSARNMGQIAEGQKIEISFRFRNTGNKPLVIERVQPSCGCTVADVPKEPIAPGKEGVIKGVFDSAAKPGLNTKTMTVFANTEGTQQHVISFTVDVQKKTS
ncbi:MAG TPA: DUF1573 domain-containing protein [Chitinophagaceae bacterium]